MTVFLFIFLITAPNTYTVPQPPVAIELEACIDAALLFNKQAVETTSPYRALCLPIHTEMTNI